MFNPVMLPITDGTEGAYVDDSIASDPVVEIARTVAKNIHVILVDAPTRRTTYANAVAVRAYATMQREILEVAMRDVYERSQVNRALHGLDLATPRLRPAAVGTPGRLDGLRKPTAARRNVRDRRT